MAVLSKADNFNSHEATDKEVSYRKGVMRGEGRREGNEDHSKSKLWIDRQKIELRSSVS